MGARWIAAAALAACGPAVEQAPDGAGDPPDADAPFYGKVYAHSYQNLYAIDPDTLAVDLIGGFGWPADTGVDMMTDIAVDKDGDIFGISFGAVYAVDQETADVTWLAALDGQSFNGLSFLPGDGPDDEILVATGLAGLVYRIDPATGAATEIGDYGGAIESSGDLVSVTGLGTLATVKNGSTLDYLARVDEATGTAVILGPTGYADIWGVGFWKDKVFGFVATNEFVLIDPDTGAATYVTEGPENWAGAGVTTSAPYVP